MKWKFCQLSEFERVNELRLLIKYTDRFKRDLRELAYADLNSNFKFRGFLRSIWPHESHISLFSIKCHISIAFVHIWQFTGYFVIDLILLQKQGFIHVSLGPQ